MVVSEYYLDSTRRMVESVFDFLANAVPGLEYGDCAALVAEGEALPAAFADAARGNGKRLGVRWRPRRIVRVYGHFPFAVVEEIKRKIDSPRADGRRGEIEPAVVSLADDRVELPTSAGDGARIFPRGGKTM